jgi:hypothetical protein
VDGTRAMELRVVSGKNHGTGKPSGATPGARSLGNPITDEASQARARRTLRSSRLASSEFQLAGIRRTGLCLDRHGRLTAGGRLVPCAEWRIERRVG